VILKDYFEKDYLESAKSNPSKNDQKKEMIHTIIIHIISFEFRDPRLINRMSSATASHVRSDYRGLPSRLSCQSIMSHTV